MLMVVTSGVTRSVSVDRSSEVGLPSEQRAHSDSGEGDHDSGGGRHLHARAPECHGDGTSMLASADPHVTRLGEGIQSVRPSIRTMAAVRSVYRAAAKEVFLVGVEPTQGGVGHDREKPDPRVGP